MTTFFDKVFSRYPVKTRRALEILPGLFSWTVILFPVWGAIFIPYVVAYFILFFDVYWLYKSFSLAISAYISAGKIKRAEKLNWVSLASEHKDFEKVNHVVIIPNYQESAAKIRETLSHIANQTFPTKRIYVFLGMEEREEAAKERGKIILEEFKDKFGGIFVTFHPDIPGEVKGKSSNEAYAGKEAYKLLIETGKLDLDFATISSVDADSVFDKQYFAYLSFKFLNDPKRYHKFWQSANVNYNNFWSVPPPVRVISFFGSLHRTALLIQGDRMVSNSTYSLSFKLLKNIGFWDTDVIPEDYRIFFKAFYRLQGEAWVDPIFLKTSMDCPKSSSFIKTLKNKYEQERRWSWGVSDDPLFIKWWFTVPGVPFVRKTMMLYNVLLDHFLWPVNWFIITVAANVTTLVNPVFSRTALGYSLSNIAGIILTACLLSLFAMVIIDFRHRPDYAKRSIWRHLIFPIEFILLPVAGFFLSTLPALISHTQLMFGKHIEYKVTEKL